VVSSPDSQVGIALELKAWSQFVDVNSALPEGTRGAYIKVYVQRSLLAVF
jgi:hypothetical protein